jgi:hypothetical protein
MATASSITERQPRNFEPRPISFPSETKEAIAKWIEKQIQALCDKWKRVHEKEIPEMRRILDAEPKDKSKSWPFPNCSNLVHPLAAEAVDDLSARVLQLIWGTSPVMNFRYFTEAEPDEAKRNSKKAKTLEAFFDYVAYEPLELDLYTRENEWFTDSAGLGKARVCVAPEERIEAVYAGYQSPSPNGTKGKSAFNEETLYEGPKVINLAFEDILIDNPDIPFEDNDPIIRRCTLKKRKLMERAYKGHFDPEKVKAILGNPDRFGPSDVKRRENQRKGLQDSQDNTMAEWDIYECYFSWWHNQKKFRLICWFHQHSKTMLNDVYNFIPKNRVPIVETRLSIKGKGFAKMLQGFQDEISTAKNQRNDAITYGMLGVNTLDNQNKTIDRNFTLWPGMFIPAKKDTFQHYEMANAAVAGLSLQNEELMVQQAKMRAGIDPAIRGAGAGGTNKKGQYGAMATLSTMQDGNSRNDHRTSDFRHSHVKLGGLCVDFYGFMGLGSKARIAGLSEQLLTEALDDHLSRVLKISMRAATASMNREITKQNLIILNQAVSGYIKETSSQIQALMTATSPEPYNKWLLSVIISKTLLMQEIVKQFQISEQPQEFVPDLKEIEEFVNGQAQAASAGGGGGPLDIQKMAELVRQRASGGGATAQPGVGGGPIGPTGQGSVPLL